MNIGVLFAFIACVQCSAFPLSRFRPSHFAPKGCRPLETCTRRKLAADSVSLTLSARCESLRDSLGGALYRRAPPSAKRSPGAFCSIPPFGAPPYEGEFRRLRTATRDAVSGLCELLKKLDQNFCEAANRLPNARPAAECKKGADFLHQHPLVIHNGVWGLVPSGVWGGAPFQIRRRHRIIFARSSSGLPW